MTPPASQARPQDVSPILQATISLAGNHARIMAPDVRHSHVLEVLAAEHGMRSWRGWRARPDAELLPPDETIPAMDYRAQALGVDSTDLLAALGLALTCLRRERQSPWPPGWHLMDLLAALPQDVWSRSAAQEGETEAEGALRQERPTCVTRRLEVITAWEQRRGDLIHQYPRMGF
ncbi:hypothetical protein GCM10008955_41310 [Deinococcus malanensis]|uniref:Uncharacterized protein n=1 Tax=Deinococcus malanensis TaxID=1706855 RepID=A0ABQ2F2F1_9DEIO|nr:hypothetical protein [Deinococcus malanensis]GGK43269.1 hypothetical protein GCM10008955_41310 [Deinococcus malanensis]